MKLFFHYWQNVIIVGQILGGKGVLSESIEMRPSISILFLRKITNKNFKQFMYLQRV